jgi:hypothetical protein
MRKPLLVALAIVSFLYSCTKIQSTDIGTGLIPTVDGVITKDTLLDVFTTTRLDSSLTRVYKSDDHVIGVINNDPLFGKTTASAFFELKPQFYKFFFPGTKANLIADSAVLVLSYRGFYGDSLQPQTWRVFEINAKDTLKYDSSYSTNAVINFSNQLGAKPIEIRRLADSVKYGFENAKNQIRIRLADAFAQRLIKQYDSSNAYASDKDFRKNFAGFAVVPDAGSGNALIRVNLLDTNTKLSLYYRFKTDAAAKHDTAVGYFRFRLGGDQTSGNANRIVRDRTGAAVTAAISNPAANDVVYVQTSPGTFATVRIPGLTSFPNSLIHRAELITEQSPTNDPVINSMAPPRYLLLSAYDSATKSRINLPNDYQLDQTGAPNYEYFGGLLNYKTQGTQRLASYKFNISRYVQGIVSRKDKNHLLLISAPTNDSLSYSPAYPFTGKPASYYITPGSANNTADGRVKLHGGSTISNPNRMRLRIIYSRL